MEPLPPALVAALTPKDVEIRFYDDRLEEIPYDEPTDLVAISVETYTAKRAYQIASEYRKRGVPVVMGGFHTTLVPEEVEQYAESIVIGEAEPIWAELIDDYRGLIDSLIGSLDAGNYDRAVEIAGLYDMVRGYDDIKLANVVSYRAKLAEALADW